jgi:uncharacterized protein YjbI with pentapeptide repeats
MEDLELILVALGAITAAAVFWWVFPKRRAATTIFSSEAERRQYEDGLREAVSKFMGGLAVAGGILITLYQTLETRRLTITTQILDQFQKASENLANPDLRFHSAAMYSLLQAAKVRDDLRTSVLYQLSQAAVYSEGHSNPPPAAISTCPPAPGAYAPTENRAALSALAQRPFLQNVTLPLGFDHANLSGTSLSHGFLNFSDFSDSDLSGSDLYGAHLYQASLRRTRLNGVNLSGADLSNASLKDAWICPGPSFSVPALEDAATTVSQVSGTAFFGSILDGAHFVGANLRGSSIRDGSQVETDFTDAQLCKATFAHANLAGAKFLRTSAPQATFGLPASGDASLRSNLNRAAFTEAYLHATSFENTDLEGAVFERSDLTAARFTGSSADKATFQGEDECEVTWIDGRPKRVACTKTAEPLAAQRIDECTQFIVDPPPWSKPEFQTYSN